MYRYDLAEIWFPCAEAWMESTLPARPDDARAEERGEPPVDAGSRPPVPATAASDPLHGGKLAL
jgi:hypothetical protein